MAAQRADPALLGDHDGDRLALDQASSIAASSCSGASAKSVRRLPSARLRAERLAHLLDLAGDRLPLLLLGAEQLLRASLRSARSSLSSALDLHLLELAQIAQPHVEDGVGLHVGELEGLDQDRLGLVLVADDLDDLVEVEIGDQIAAQHFEPMLDLPRGGSCERRTSTSRRWSSHSRQRFREADHLGDAALDQHVHVERNAALELGELEQRFHQQLGIDRARARLDHEADVLGRLVAHVGDQRQLLAR